MYQKAANYFGRRARSIFPVLPPERVARRIVRLAERRRVTIISLFGHLLRVATAIRPLMMERLVSRTAPTLQFQADAEPPQPGNAFNPHEPHAVEGGWRRYWAARALAPMSARVKRRPWF
jgi:hypothetical protein